MATTMRTWLKDHPSALRTTSFAALAIFCVLTVGAWKLFQGNEEVSLIQGRTFRPVDLTAIQTALACANISDYRIVEGKILVPRRHRNMCLQALEKSGALRSRYDAQLEVLAPSLLDTRQTREQKQREQLQLRLAQVIESIRGVAEASVRYSENVEGGLHRRVDRRALVAVRAEGDQPVSAAQQHAIRQSVLASVAGLKVDDVTITDLNYPEAPTTPSHPDGDSDRVAQESESLLRQFEREARSILGKMPRLHVAARQLPQEFIGDAHLRSLPSTPGFRPAVNIQGESAILLHVTAPAKDLSSHFQTDGSEEAIAQHAAIHLRDTLGQMTGQPVAVVVTAEPSTVADPATVSESQAPSQSNTLATKRAFTQWSAATPQQMLWTCPLLLVACGWLWSAWRRDRLAKEFSAEVRRRPEQLAAVLEDWADEADRAAVTGEPSQVAT